MQRLGREAHGPLGRTTWHDRALMPGPAYFVVAALAFVAVLGLVAWRTQGSMWSRGSRAVLAAGFAVGAVTHLENLARLGWIPAPAQPLTFNVFWTSLAVLDPLAAVLLTAQPRAGLVLAALILVVDLVINAIAFLPDPSAPLWPIASQVALALFLAVTAPRTYREAGGSD